MCIRLYLVKPAQRLSQLIFLVLSVASSHVMAEQASKINGEAMRSEITTCVDNLTYDSSDVEDSLMDCPINALFSCSKFNKFEQCQRIIIRSLKTINSDLLIYVNHLSLANEYQNLLKKYSELDQTSYLNMTLGVEVGTFTALSMELVRDQKKFEVTKP